MRKWLLLSALTFVLPNGFSQQDSLKQDNYPKILQKLTGLAEWGVDLLTVEKPKYTFFVLPLLGYEERTKIEVGVMPVLQFYLGGKDNKKYLRPSSIEPSVIVSTSGMYEFDLTSGFYTSNRWLFENKWLFQYMPDKFYGISNEEKHGGYSTFDITKYEFRGRVMRGITDEFFVGMAYDIGLYSINNIDGDILTKEILGYDGGDIVGLGPSFNYDTRNSTNYTVKGNYLEITWRKYFNTMGDFNFSSLIFDARKYYKLGKKDRVLAMQLYSQAIGGEAPFFRKATLGGKRLFRGIGHPFEYMENNAAYVQLEYRSHLWWRLGYTAFTGVGNVFNRWGQETFSNIHTMVGIGGRFSMLESEKLNLRIDYGLTNRGSSGFFFTLGEAF